MQKTDNAWGVIRSTADLWLTHAPKLILVNVLWALSMYTVILAPPAMIALSAVTRDLMREKPISARSYYQHLKAHFFGGWLWGLINIFFGVLIYSNIAFYTQNLPDYVTIAYAVIAVLVLIWCAVQFYVVAYLAWQWDRQLFVAHRNALYTLGASPIFNLTILLCVGLIGLVSVYLSLLPLLAAASFMSLLANMALDNRLRAFGLLDENTEPPTTTTP